MKINKNKEDIEKFNKSDIGKIKNIYIKRATIIGIISVIIGIIWLIYDICYKSNIYDLIMSILLLIYGFYAIINIKRIKLKEVNKYIYENKKTQK